MNRAVLLAVCFGSASVASAGPAAWCKEKSDFNSEDVRTLQNGESDEIVKSLAQGQCTAGGDADAHRADIQKGIATWGPRYGLKDADWADVLAWDKDPSFTFSPAYSVKSIAQMTPIDQYMAIDTQFKVADGHGETQADPVYITDIFDAGGHLSETGRLAFLEWCAAHLGDSYDDDDAVKFAICADDAAKFDANKVFDEVRADKAHEPVARMVIRVHAYHLAKHLKDMADFKAKLIKKDDEYGKVWDAAAKGRAEWIKGVGTDKKLLSTIEQVESGVLFHSRKQLDGCEKTTAEALATAVSKIPAKEFATMHDVRDDPFHGFAYKAANVLVRYPAVTVAGAAFIECQPTRGWSKYLAATLYGVPGSRGPRNAALSAVMATTFKFDDTQKKGLNFPLIEGGPYKSVEHQSSSAGGAVATVKPEGDHLNVALEKTFVMQEDCVASHRGRASRIVFSGNSGTIEYDSICDKTAMVKHDITWADFKVAKTSQQWLKPGVLFSGNYGGDAPEDIFAIWPNKTAKVPSMFLGATLK